MTASPRTPCEVAEVCRWLLCQRSQHIDIKWISLCSWSWAHSRRWRCEWTLGDMLPRQEVAQNPNKAGFKSILQKTWHEALFSSLLFHLCFKPSAYWSKWTLINRFMYVEGNLIHHLSLTAIIGKMWFNTRAWSLSLPSPMQQAEKKNIQWLSEQGDYRSSSVMSTTAVELKE